MARIVTPNVNLPKLKGIHLTVEFPDTGLLVCDRWEEAHSWVHNAYVFQAAAMADFFGSGATDRDELLPGELFTIDISGTMRSQTTAGLVSTTDPSYTAGIGQDLYGILIGTGDGEFHRLRHTVDGQIEHGTGSGEMTHNAMSAPVQSYDSETKKYTLTHSRIFNNNSGASITVNCVGLVVNANMWSLSNYLMAYDKLSSGVAVADGAQLTVTYEVESAACDWLDIYDWPSVGDEAFGGWVGAASRESAGYTGQFLIVAPKTDGEGSALTFSDPAQGTTPTTSYPGVDNTADLVALGAASEIGAFCAAANADNLGGYNDWYIPSYNELADIFANLASAPDGEGFESAKYWSSTRVTSSNAYANHMGTGAASQDAQTTESYVRLVRRVFPPLAG